MAGEDKGMKAMLLVAGRGTRLRPITDYIPKAALPIAGVPLLHIWIRKLEDTGVTHLFINPSHGGHYIQECILDAKPKIDIITIRNEKEPLGTAGTIKNAGDWIDGDDFFVIYGDNLSDVSLLQLKTQHHKPAVLTMFAYRTSKPRHKGIIELGERGWMKSFEEKPDEPKSDLASSGIAYATPELLDYISEEDTDLSRDVLPKLAGKMLCYVPGCYIRDIGTIPDYLACQQEWWKLNECNRISR
jgi:mannose-1-phosphate guanylyltransferase